MAISNKISLEKKGGERSKNRSQNICNGVGSFPKGTGIIAYFRVGGSYHK